MVRAEDGTIQPGLATEWEFEDNALVITLREGVVFHDGTPFDADAVKANLDRQMTVEGGTQKSFLAPVDTVEVVDDTTVRLNAEERGRRARRRAHRIPGGHGQPGRARG